MFGRDGNPSPLYNELMLDAADFLKVSKESQALFKPKKKVTVSKETFDICSFATCIAESRKKKRSTSIQYKTMYLDDEKNEPLQDRGKFDR